MRWLFMLAIAAVLAFLGLTVPLGKRTFFEHVRAVWKTEEVQDMKKGIEEKAGPAVQRVKRGVEAGYKEVAREDEAPRPGATESPANATDHDAAGASAGAPQEVPKAPAETTPTNSHQPVTKDTAPVRPKKSTPKKSTKSTTTAKTP